MLCVEDLTKGFRLALTRDEFVEAFRDIHFVVAPGTFLGISGPSGEGKSSILKCIYRTYLVDSGRVWYDSLSFGRVDLAEISDQMMLYLRNYEIGFVSQFLRVVPRVSAIDVIMHRLLATGEEETRARARSKEMLERLRIPDSLWDAYPVTFSGGEQQRMNLARALVTRPRLLLLDEPTASLDDETSEVVLDILRAMKEAGTAMVGVLHNREQMQNIADEVLDLRLEKRLERTKQDEGATGDA